MRTRPSLILLVTVTALSSVACGRHRRAKGAADPQATAQEPAAEAAPAVPEQTVLDWAIQTLQSKGYTCAVEETRYVCAVPGSNWPLTVSWVVETDKTTLWFDSYETRAFGQRCARYTNHMRDLASVPSSFTVSCDDTTQTFRMNTALQYSQELDLMPWVQSHLEQRASSQKLLRSAGALRKPG